MFYFPKDSILLKKRYIEIRMRFAKRYIKERKKSFRRKDGEHI